MTRYVGFLRGINVGKADNKRRIAMGDLRVSFEALGFTGVATILQGGTVLFNSSLADHEKLHGQIETSLSQRFGYPANVIITRFDSIGKIIAGYPFNAKATELQHYIVFVSASGFDELAKAARSANQTSEQIQAGNGVLYWVVPKGMSTKSEFAKILSKAKYKEHNTVRNIKTLQKIIT